MARKRNEPAQEVVVTPSNQEIIPDGDFAGMRYEDVLAAVTGDLENVFIERDIAIEAVMPITDLFLANNLAVVAHAMGAKYTKEAAIRICQTALPYALVEIEAPVTYASIAKARKE
jgi:hypothetical protein